MKRLLAITIGFGAALVLAACGSGSSDATPAQPPEAATPSAPTSAPSPTLAPSPTASPTAPPLATPTVQPSPTAAPDQSTPLTYANEVVGFAISHPGDWARSVAADAVFLSHPSGASVAVTFEPLEGLTVEDYASLLADSDGFSIQASELRSDPPGVLIAGETSLGGQPAGVTALVADHFGIAVGVVGTLPMGASAGLQATFDDIMGSAAFSTPTALTFDEHGDIPETGTPLALAATVASIINHEEDADFFGFSARRGQHIVAEVDLGGLLDSFLALYGDDGACILTLNDDVGASLASRIVWQVQKDGTYYVSVSNPDFVSTGSYTLSLFEDPAATPTDDHGNERCSASPINPGASTPGAIEDPSDADFYVIEASAGQAFTVSVQRGTLGAAFAAVFDERGDVALALNPGQADDPVVSFDWTAPADGTYYVDVENADSVSTGTYTLTVSLR